MKFPNNETIVITSLPTPNFTSKRKKKMDDKNNKIAQPMHLNIVIITCASDNNLK